MNLSNKIYLLFIFCCYQMLCSDTSSKINKQKFNFCVLADTQAHDGSGAYNIKVSPALVTAMKKRKPFFTVFPGDLVEDGTVARWKKWLELTKGLGDNRYIVPGNHDLHPIRGGTMKQWQKVFAKALPWVNETAKKNQVGPLVPSFDGKDHAFGDRRAVDYYVDYGNTRIICVATDGAHKRERDTNPPANLAWFRKVMKLPSTKAKTNVIVFTHKPLTMDGYAGNPDTGGTAWTWWKAISGQDNGSAKADAIFTGHWHMYRPGRPDAGKTSTMEIIVGTGGGHLEGYHHHQVHGFLEIMVDNDKITARFWGDDDGKRNGWQFDDILDTFVIDPGVKKKYRGELAKYNFEGDEGIEDNSDSIHSRKIPLRLKYGAKIVKDSNTKRNKVLSTGDGMFALTEHLSDHNLGLVGNLKISLYAKAQGKLSGKEGDNVLISYGCGRLNGRYSGIPKYDTTKHLRNESENYAYVLSVNPDGKLRLAWQYRRCQKDSIAPKRKKGQKARPKRLLIEAVNSTKSIVNVNKWNRIEVVRNAEKKTIDFYLNGKKLGKTRKFHNHATGGQLGTLAIGGLSRTKNINIQAMDWKGFIDDVIIER